MTQLLQTAIEAARQQPRAVQNVIAQRILEVVQSTQPQPRPIGLADGLVSVPPDFNQPLSEDELALWEGEGPDDPLSR